ncbi:MAG: hypothetical protein MRZ41_00175 [Eubacterium sp.]|nr:hypothetical protein [Eubacterium sp.]
MALLKLKKGLVASGILLAALAVNPLSAVPDAQAPATVCAAQAEEAAPYADVIYFVYRTYNGWVQRRRWNETRGYWVDPYWMNVKPA